MGTITQRKNKNGTVKYSAQIRLKRGGEVVYQEAQSFDRRQVAIAWLKRRETELAEPGAIDRANRKGVTVKSMIERYLVEYERIRPLGKTKSACLKAISNTWLGLLLDSDLSSQKLVEYAQWRMSEEGGGILAQTLGNDLAHLSAVMSVARPAWGYQIDPHAMTDARIVLRKLGMVAKSNERDRRPALEELDRVMQHYGEMMERGKLTIPMQTMVNFAIFSTRRQEEITRIRWADLDEER